MTATAIWEFNFRFRVMCGVWAGLGSDRLVLLFLMVRRLTC